MRFVDETNVNQNPVDYVLCRALFAFDPFLLWSFGDRMREREKVKPIFRMFRCSFMWCIDKACVAYTQNGQNNAIIIGTVVKSFVFAYHTCISQWSQFLVLHPLNNVYVECVYSCMLWPMLVCLLHWKIDKASEYRNNGRNE